MNSYGHEFEHMGTRREQLLSRLSHSLNKYGVAQNLEAKELCFDNYRRSLQFLRKKLTSSGLRIREWNLFGSMAPVLRLPFLQSILLPVSKARLGIYPLEYTLEDALATVTSGHNARNLPSDIDLILDADNGNISPRDQSYIKYFARKSTFDEYGVFVQFK
ncbi:MAG: hypothetical protein ACOY3M_06835 [Patescibacteria group bacterium]